MSPQNARFWAFILEPSAVDLKCAPWLLTWLMMCSFGPPGRYPYITPPFFSQGEIWKGRHMNSWAFVIMAIQIHPSSLLGYTSS